MSLFDRFISLTKYPDAVQLDNQGVAVLQFDGSPVELQLLPQGTLRITAPLEPLATDEDDQNRQLEKALSLAFPQVLKSDEVLCYDPELKVLLIWTELSEPITDDALLEAVEKFLTSRDWWNRQLADAAEEPPSVASSLLYFRP